MVLLHFQEVIHVRMPRLKVHCERPFSLATPLVNIASSLVEVPKHGDKPIAVSVCATNVRSCGTNVGTRNSNAPGAFGYLCTLLQSVVDTIDAIRLNGEQKARRHLRFGGPSIEE